MSRVREAVEDAKKHLALHFSGELEYELEDYEVEDMQQLIDFGEEYLQEKSAAAARLKKMGSAV
jgi:hypothetical protein